MVRVVEPVRLPSPGLVLPSIRTRLQSAARAELTARLRAARREVTAAAARLRRAGWLARAVVRVGVPLPQLFRIIREERANVLALGASGAGGARRFFLGSVANGALRRATIPVLIVP